MTQKGHDVSQEHSSTQRAKRIAVIAIVIVVAILVGFFAWHYFSSTEKPGEVETGVELTVTIPKGSTAGEIAQILKDGKVIAKTTDFLDELDAEGLASQLKPGVYTFIGGSSNAEIIAALVAGTSGITLTIPEGFSLKQIAKRVHRVCGIKKKTFLKTAASAKKYEKDYPFLKSAYKNSMEGFLYPETYTLSSDADADEIVRKMLDAYSNAVSNIDLFYAKKKKLDAYDVLILASIVEKESYTNSDKKKIASVFYNRLAKGINLGSDVTTYYAVGKDLSETLTASDLASKSPYNTRRMKKKGLPPGPICSPGKASLKAAARPANTDNLYFFYSSSKGKVMFYKTLKSFNAGWKKYGS